MKADKKIVTIEHDISKDNEFAAKFVLGPNSEELSITVEIDHNSSEKLTFDSVEMAIDKAIEEKYPLKSYPDLEVKSYSVYCTDISKWCPVVSESDKQSIAKLKKNKKIDRYLVLPDATYSLTEEAKLWLSLKNQGIIAEKSEFDFEKMHKLVISIEKQL